MKKILLSSLLLVSFFFQSKGQQIYASDSSGCGILCVTFTSSVTNAVSYIWVFGDGNNSTGQNPTNCYTIPGTYNVSLTTTDINGNTSTITVPNMITVFPIPIASFNFTINGYCVTFTDLSGGATSWSWDFGDGSPLNNTQNPTHCYPNDSTYCVYLLVQNPFGCADSIQNCLILQMVIRDSLSIPNIFTPNFDGTNDVFEIKGLQKGDKVQIYNRWGTLLFKSQSEKQFWDGYTTSGEPCINGVYFYTITLQNGETRKGYLTLIK